MKIVKLAGMAALVIGLGVAGASAGDNTFNGGAEDDSGFWTIGVDVINAGTTPQSVQQYVAGLGQSAARSVELACTTAIAYPNGYHPNVVTFCRNLEGG